MANYTILMDEIKYLTVTASCNIYQHESMVDTLYFIVPQKYNGYDLGEYICSLVIKYPSGKIEIELLEHEEELYKEKYYRYSYKAKSSNITREIGNILVGLKFNYTDVEQLVQYSLATSDCIVEVKPRSDIYNFTDESLEKFDQMIGKLDARLQYMNMQTDKLLAGKVDDLAFDEDGKLHVASVGEILGEGVNVAVPGTQDIEDEETDGVIDADEIYKIVEI